MLKMLNRIFRYFVATKDQVIAKQIKDRHKRSTSSPGSEALNRWRGPGL